jgi:phospholipid-translocating ATPase
MVLFN